MNKDNIKKLKKSAIASLTALSLCVSPAADAKKRNNKPTLTVKGGTWKQANN